MFGVSLEGAPIDETSTQPKRARLPMGQNMERRQRSISEEGLRHGRQPARAVGEADHVDPLPKSVEQG